MYAGKAACLKGIESVQANAPYAPVEDQTAKDFETEANPKFELYRDNAEQFRFRLKAGNGEIIAASQAYKAKASCLKGIDSVRANAVSADITEESAVEKANMAKRAASKVPGTQTAAEEQQKKAAAPHIENKKITDGNYDKSLAVRCVNGTFVGSKSEGVITYKGIPFVGKQPVGELRWKAPVDVVPDDGIYEAYHFGKAASQAAEVSDHQGEDCLYLNVWKAEDASAGKKPVMVYIHGGAFVAGSADMALFDCAELIRENPEVIVVTIQYRMGVFGYLHLSHLPDGKDYPDAQNLGLLDQKMALKWVHENIAGFGGDPDNVTIWGESAGAISCVLLPLVKGSQQYFQKVISQSGSPMVTSSLEEAVASTNILMEALGCKTVADLNKVDARKLLDVGGELLTLRMLPVRDGRHLPVELFEAFANGAAKDITFLQGCNKDEMNFFVTVLGVDGWNAWIADRKTEKYARLTDDEKARVESFCSEGTTEEWERSSRLLTQSWFAVGAVRMSEDQTKGGGKSYTYYYRVESSDPILKSGHGEELPIVFFHPEMTDGRPYDATFSKTMRKMWVQFARTGNPSLSADASPDGKAKDWPLYDLENKNVMVLDEFDIHPAKEADVKIVDWDRSYFLTKYYLL